MYVQGIAGNTNNNNFQNLFSFDASNAYGFGIVVRRKITGNGFLVSGLGYTHLSTKIVRRQNGDPSSMLQNVDSRNNYVITAYPQNGKSAVHINFDFIELPVHFQQDLFAKKPVGLSWNAGVSLRQLVSSNIIIGKDQVNKTQFELSGGLNVRFNAGKITSLYAGPQFSYSLSDALKNKNSGNFHFINYGLQAGLILHKK